MRCLPERRTPERFEARGRRCAGGGVARVVDRRAGGHSRAWSASTLRRLPGGAGVRAARSASWPTRRASSGNDGEAATGSPSGPGGPTRSRTCTSNDFVMAAKTDRLAQLLPDAQDRRLDRTARGDGSSGPAGRRRYTFGHGTKALRSGWTGLGPSGRGVNLGTVVSGTVDRVRRSQFLAGGANEDVTTAGDHFWSPF